ncbi:MAG TPA: hypothetical protein VLC08_07045 [Chitinolyticbacter sp.]|nr:hypothetical protein [Chitinolyticbacter sp.]
MKSLLTLPLIALLLACSGQPPSMLGNWTIDLDPMLAEARTLNAKPADLDALRATYEGGQLAVTSSEMVLGIGGKDQTTWRYQVLSQSSDCYDIKFDHAPGTYKHCIDGNQMRVHDPDTRLTTVFRRD